MEKTQVYLKAFMVTLLGLSSVCLLPTQVMSQVTSVSQLTDVTPRDHYFQDLKSLVEKYGCSVSYPDKTFRARRSITRYEFASGFNACLDRLEEFAASSNAEQKFRRRISSYKPLLSNGKNISSVAELKDVRATDWAFQPLQSLVERYEILFALPDGTFRGNEPLTQAQFADYMNGVFGYNQVPGKKEPLTRGDFVKYLNRSLNHATQGLF